MCIRDRSHCVNSFIEYFNPFVCNISLAKTNCSEIQLTNLIFCLSYLNRTDIYLGRSKFDIEIFIKVFYVKFMFYMYIWMLNHKHIIHLLNI